jgi:sugar phosphate permease
MFGWSALFYVFVVLAMLSALSLAPTWRRKPLSTPAVLS